MPARTARPDRSDIDRAVHHDAVDVHAVRGSHRKAARVEGQHAGAGIDCDDEDAPEGAEEHASVGGKGGAEKDPRGNRNRAADTFIMYCIY